MFKINLTQIMMVFACTFAITAANAQTVLWGTGHSNPAIDSIGEFASTDSTLAGAGWTATAIIPNANWAWSSTGISAGGFGAGSGLHINSPSLGNGVAMFDSDYFYDQNIVPQEAKLTSPAIDLTGYADSLVLVKFYAGLRDFASDSNVVRFSKDGGATWVSLDVITALGHISNGAATERIVTFNISSQPAGATNLTDCRIEFYFKGDSYFWSVDDVSIETFVPSFDLALNEDNPSIVTLGSAELPLAFVNDTETSWGVNVKNTGFINLAASAAMLHMDVYHRSGGVWVYAASDSMSLPSIDAGMGYFAYKTTIGNANWMPTDTGAYRVTYVLKTALVQTDMNNDSLITFFRVSDNNYLSKVPTATDGYPVSDNALLAGLEGTNLPIQYELGSMYYIPPGLTNPYFLNQIKYRAAYSNVISGTTQAIIQARVYRFSDANGDGFWTPAVSGPDAELPLLAVGNDTFTLATGPAAYGTGEMTLLDIDNLTTGIQLESDSFYVVTLLQENASGLRNATNQSRAAFIGVNDFHYESTTDSMPSYFIPACVVRIATGDGAGTISANQWYTGYTPPSPVPSIGLVIERRNNVAVTQSTVELAGVEVFPNPTVNQFTATLNLEKASDVRYVLTDLNGLVLDLKNVKNVSNEARTWDISNFPAGVYFLHVKANGVATTKRIVKN